MSAVQAIVIHEAENLWEEYCRLYDQIEALTDPKSKGSPREIGNLADRAGCVIANLSFARPTSPAGAAASLRAAKVFAAEAQDADDEIERDAAHRALARCLDASLAALEGERRPA